MSMKTSPIKLSLNYAGIKEVELLSIRGTMLTAKQKPLLLRDATKTI